MIKEKLRKFWNFLSEDTIASWLVSLILAFVIVKFIFFPVLSLTLLTSMPLVVVESGSMHHPGSFIGNVIGLEDTFEIWWNEKGRWYEEKDIKIGDAREWPLKTGLEIGDIVVVYGDKTPEVGDIIIFDASQKHPLIHRIIDISEDDGLTIYSTKGDNNEDQIYFEKNIPETAIIGKALIRIPKIGWIKLIFARAVEAIIN